MTVQARITQIQKNHRNNKPMTIIPFWGTHSDYPDTAVFSNFERALFTDNVIVNEQRDVKEITFESSEQYFMYLKALHFEDYESIAKMIDPGHSPKHYKKLGRKVENYNDNEWAKVRYAYMLKAIRLKFGQNDQLKKTLLNTNDAIIVEASPYDKIWGIGIGEKDRYGNKNSDWKNPLNWKGQNLLGFALMDLREEFENTTEKES